MTGDLTLYPPAAPAHRVDEAVLPGTAERMRQGVPANTQRSYERAWNAFAAWCAANGRSSLPASSVTLADYVAYLCDEGRAPSTIQHDLAVIAKCHQMVGHPKGTPSTQAANLVLRGYRHERAAGGTRKREAPPITRARLRQMSAACDASTVAGKRDRLLLVIGWAMAGRRSELAGLRIEDITVGVDDLDVLVRSSKTDKGAVGELVNVPAGEHAHTDPVGLLHDWLEALAATGADASSGPLFRAVTPTGRLVRVSTRVRAGDGATVRFGGFTADAVNDAVRRAAVRAELPHADRYTAHSLRAGFATQAALDGVPMPIWARHGRWSPTSTVPAGYVRASSRKLDNPLRKMGL